MSGFQTPISIKEAINKIVERKYLLPAIQRKFVWSASKVEALFDSIMQGYPINSFMFWQITSKEVKNSLSSMSSLPVIVLSSRKTTRILTQKDLRTLLL